MSDLIPILMVIWRIVEIVLGVGFVIFVHELGHFAIAKMCGVKCEKFYLGFDIAGWKICKFRYGETEYGIGILPLGGYVKMLGQEDNPAKLKEEIERAKLDQAGTSGDKQPADKETACEIDIAEAEKALYDPRSYLAKSVPKRMAIISAGVIMNVIFAFLMAVVAFSIGVEQMEPVVGQVLPGGAAWRADLRPGDKILEIDGKKIGRFNDILKSVPFSDPDTGVVLLIERPGEARPFTRKLYPDCDGKIPRIGVFNSAVPELNKKDYLVYSGSSAISAMKPEYLGARIVEIDGEKIENFSQIDRILSDKADKTLQVTLAYVPPIDGSRQAEPPKLESVALPTQPVRTIGLVMEMGEIVAIQDGSPAQAAGLKAGDRIVEFDGKPIAACDPMRLPDLVRRRGEEPITLGIEREKGKPAEKIELKPRRIEWVNSNKDDKAPVAISQLGIAYSVSNRVDHIERNSPAAKAGIAKGAEVEWIKLTPPKGKTMKPFVAEQKAITCDLPKDVRWPAVFDCLQMVDPDSTVELKLNDRKETISMGLADVEGWYNTDRGLIFEGRKYIEQAAGFKEACRLGATETWDSMTMVVRFMRGMGSGRISATNVGGPFSIFWAAYYAAERGFGSLLIFLTMLSANLAVLNVLPIPMLDGGHLVFLGYEGVRGKPANERVQIVLSIIGFVMILALMIFACGLDIQRFLFR